MGQLTYEIQENERMAIAPDISHIITEDDEPVDSIFSEKQQRLMTESLYTSWTTERPFIASANVGIFYDINLPPIVPDMFLSMDVSVAQDLWKKENRSYFLWKFGKPPELSVEIISDTKRGEIDRKLEIYAQIGVKYYIVFDPQQVLLKDYLRIFELNAGKYLPKADRKLIHLNLGVTLWEGKYEGANALWLRWCDDQGRMILNGKESAELAKKSLAEER